MPFLGFVTRRSSSTSSTEGAGIKQQLRKAKNQGPNSSAVSIESGVFGDLSHMDPPKRHSISSLLSDKKSSQKGSPKLAPHKPAKLWLNVESPPLVSFFIFALHMQLPYQVGSAADQWYLRSPTTSQPIRQVHYFQRSCMSSSLIPRLLSSLWRCV